jgi:hypothetical protein
VSQSHSTRYDCGSRFFLWVDDVIWLDTVLCIIFCKDFKASSTTDGLDVEILLKKILHRTHSKSFSFVHCVSS